MTDQQREMLLNAIARLYEMEFASGKSADDKRREAISQIQTAIRDSDSRQGQSQK